MQKKNILAIIGSASAGSSNEKLVDYIGNLLPEHFTLEIFTSLKSLPHFDPALSVHEPPQEIRAFRDKIAQADGLLICTPEYIFSIPSGLKNALEWCVASTILTDKPEAIITASASGQKGHEELQLIMKTLMANFSTDTTLLIQGVKGKIDDQGLIKDMETILALKQLTHAFIKLIPA